MDDWTEFKIKFVLAGLMVIIPFMLAIWQMLTTPPSMTFEVPSSSSLKKCYFVNIGFIGDYLVCKKYPSWTIVTKKLGHMLNILVNNHIDIYVEHNLPHLLVLAGINSIYDFSAASGNIWMQDSS